MYFRNLKLRQTLLVKCLKSPVSKYTSRVNTLSADNKYSLRYSETLRQPIRMILSKKQNTFFQYFAKFLKVTSNFEHFERKNDPHS